MTYVIVMLRNEARILKLRMAMRKQRRSIEVIGILETEGQTSESQQNETRNR